MFVAFSLKDLSARTVSSISMEFLVIITGILFGIIDTANQVDYATLNDSMEFLLVI